MYLSCAIYLYLTFRSKKAVLIMMSGAVFFNVLWYIMQIRFSRYVITEHKEIRVEGGSKTKIYNYLMILLTVFIGTVLVVVAFRGTDDIRMIWAFHEDEGWIADLYNQYVSQKGFNLGDQWGYTYGSFNLMLVSLIARTIKPIVLLDGADCIIINRILLVAALLATAWVVFYIGKRIFKSPGIGLIAAGLLLTNGKVLEMSVISNYPDIFHMLFLTLAVYYSAKLLNEFSTRDAFLAVIFLGLGFSVKYMGLPLVVILILIFRYAQGKYLNSMHTVKSKEVLGRLRKDLLLFIALIGMSPFVAFFTVNPYYAINLRRFLSQMAKVLRVYGNPSLMNHLPGSSVKVPTLGDWWAVATSGGAPDSLLFFLIIIVSSLAASYFLKRKDEWRPRESFVIVGSGFIVLWLLFVVWRSQFAFFHYFLPIIPAAYIISCSFPLYICGLFKNHTIRKLIISVTAVIFAASLSVPFINDVKAMNGGAPYIKQSSMGYASRDFAGNSRFLLSYRMLSTLRLAEGNFAFDVGDWLKKNCPDARSLITNETIFYYPPSIKDIEYWNRQMNMELLFRTMPDLLIVSDYFVEMYTKDYSQAELQSMPADQKALFLQAREFYSMIKDKESFLNYKRIHIVTAPQGWYWKRIHIYKRMGPKVLSKDIKSFSGPTINPSPNGTDIFSREDFIMPNEVYLAAFPGNPVPAHLTVEFNKTMNLSGIGFVWYSNESHPTKVTIRGFYKDKKIFEKPLAVNSQGIIPYSWMTIDGKLDKIELVVHEFKGQQRLLLRRMFVEGGN